MNDERTTMNDKSGLRMANCGLQIEYAMIKRNMHEGREHIL